MSKKPWFIGLAQALGVVIYCILVSGVFQLMQKVDAQPPAFFAAAFMLLFLVFSVATVGSLVFGYFAYLLVNKKIKPAVQVLLSTLGFCLLFVILIISVLMI
ncbi:MAG: hypothetical protein ABIJ23_01280 [Candidatus Magasanikbacteria bacterium]